VASPSVPPSSQAVSTLVGRFSLHGVIGSGGMATVHVARMTEPPHEVVAIKRVHAHLAADPELATMFGDEARITQRIAHPNVISAREIVSESGELFLVMELVLGDTLAHLLSTAKARGEPVPIPVAARIALGVLSGLTAAHEAVDEKGAPLRVVHRDVSPENVLVGVDGVPRLLDFGIAKAAGRARTTTEGQLRGKLSYMAPEQLGGLATPATDVYAVGVCLWEALTSKRLFEGETDAVLLARVVSGDVQAPSTHREGVPPVLDALVMRALCTDPAARFSSAREMSDALREAAPLATDKEVATWVRACAGDGLATRESIVGALDANVQATEAKEEAPTTSTRTPRALTVGAAVVLALLAGAALYARTPSTSSGAPPVASEAASIPIATPPVSASAAQVATPASAPSERASTAPSLGAAADAGRARLDRKPPSSVTCDPPFVIDEKTGDRRYKRECLK
jgi:hypothetical protein